MRIPDEYDPKHPQLEPRRKAVDPQALMNPRPNRVEPLDVFVGVPLGASVNIFFCGLCVSVFVFEMKPKSYVHMYMYM